MDKNMDKVIQYILERKAYYSTMDRDFTFNYIEDLDIIIKLLEELQKKQVDPKK